MLTMVGIAVGSGAGATAAPEPNTVVNSAPTDGATVQTSPDIIVIGFAEELGSVNSITVDCDGASIPLGDLEVDDDTSLSVDIPDPLPKGLCTVKWTVSDSDDQPNAEGIINFIVANDTVVEGAEPDDDAPDDATTAPPTDGGADTDDADDPDVLPGVADTEVRDLSVTTNGSIVVGRLLSTLGIAVLFGALLFLPFAWPEGVEYLVTIKFFRIVWIVAMVGTLLFVATASDAVTPDGGGSGFSPGTWLDLFEAGWAGRAALLRLVLVIAAFWVAFRPDRAIDPTTQMVALGIPGLAAAMTGISRTVGDFAALGVLLGIIHALAVAVWIGGVILLARVVLSGPGEEDLVHAVRGFSRISTPAIAITIISGVLQMFRLDGGALFSTGHGRIVVLKAVVVAAMIFVAISARQFVAQRLNRAQQMSVPLADRLERAFGAEAGIGVVTLALSAWLLAFVPPNVDAVPPIEYAIEQTHRVEAADFEAVVRLTDTEIGLTGVEVEVRRPADGLSGLVLVLSAPDNDQNFGSIRQRIPLDGPGFAVRPEAAIGFPIGIAGDWMISFDAVTPGGPISSTPQLFAVTDADGEAPAPQVTTPPTSLLTTPESNDVPADDE